MKKFVVRLSRPKIRFSCQLPCQFSWPVFVATYADFRGQFSCQFWYQFDFQLKLNLPCRACRNEKRIFFLKKKIESLAMYCETGWTLGGCFGTLLRGSGTLRGRWWTSAGHSCGVFGKHAYVPTDNDDDDDNDATDDDDDDGTRRNDRPGAVLEGFGALRVHCGTLLGDPGTIRGC